MLLYERKTIMIRVIYVCLAIRNTLDNLMLLGFGYLSLLFIKSRRNRSNFLRLSLFKVPPRPQMIEKRNKPWSH